MDRPPDYQAPDWPSTKHGQQFHIDVTVDDVGQAEQEDLAALAVADHVRGPTTGGRVAIARGYPNGADTTAGWADAVRRRRPRCHPGRRQRPSRHRSRDHDRAVGASHQRTRAHLVLNATTVDGWSYGLAAGLAADTTASLLTVTTTTCPQRPASSSPPAAIRVDLTLLGGRAHISEAVANQLSELDGGAC